VATVPQLREAPVSGEGTWIGLDVHARSVIGCAISSDGEIVTRRVGVTVEAIVSWAREFPGPVLACYEAGPTGFGLARALRGAGVWAEVVAPSKLERPSGDRVKTDRRDAERLARLARIGELPGVRVPTQAEEAGRDLVRAREDARIDLMSARHRLSKLLLRHGRVYEQGTAWTARHQSWLDAQRFELRGTRIALDEARDAVASITARRDRLDAEVAELALSDPVLAGPVGRLSCLRGVSTLTAVGLCVEIADWQRFSGSTIGAFVGLVPTEASSGSRRVQGGITKTGNSHARRLLVEAAWHHRKPLRATRGAHARRAQGQPAAVRARAESGNRRLHHRWQSLDARRKRSTISAVAVARELAGWCWSLAVLDHDQAGAG
jgi:transposase